MRSSQGYYSLIQYSEFPERSEFVNIGLLLLTEMAPRVLIKFSKNSRRVEKIFNVNLGVHYRHLQESLEERLLSEFGNSWDKDRIEKFISLRAGKVRLSSPRSVLVKEPAATLDELFDHLVSDVPPQKRRERVTSKLKAEFRIQGVEPLLERPKPVHLPQGITVKAQYAYQNGCYNLINPLSLRGDPDVVIEKASTYAIEGQLLFEETGVAERKRLVVVGDVDGENPDFVRYLEGVMDQHNVGFYEMDKLSPLVADIRKNVSVQ